MKNLMKGALLLALVGTFTIGCEKENELSPTSDVTDNTFSKSKKNNNQILKSGTETTFIDSIDFEDEFPSFGETFFTDHPYGLIKIDYQPEEKLFALTTEDPGPNLPGSAVRVICRGPKSNVVNCANIYVKFSIEGCPVNIVEVFYQDGSGRSTWEAHTNC